MLWVLGVATPINASDVVGDLRVTMRLALHRKVVIAGEFTYEHSSSPAAPQLRARRPAATVFPISYWPAAESLPTLQGGSDIHDSAEMRARPTVPATLSQSYTANPWPQTEPDSFCRA